MKLISKFQENLLSWGLQLEVAVTIIIAPLIEENFATHRQVYLNSMGIYFNPIEYIHIFWFFLHQNFLQLFESEEVDDNFIHCWEFRDLILPFDYFSIVKAFDYHVISFIEPLVLEIVANSFTVFFKPLL